MSVVKVNVSRLPTLPWRGRVRGGGEQWMFFNNSFVSFPQEEGVKMCAIALNITITAGTDTNKYVNAATSTRASL